MAATKTAVVFGASGLIGSYLVKELINNPTYGKIYLVVRKPLVIVNNKVEEIPFNEFENKSLEELNLPDSHVFCCIGTTIKTAGSREEFRKVDYELPQKFAAWAKARNINTFAVVSSIGANATSTNFYLRTKGEMEESLMSLQFEKLIIVRPSLLMGTRNEFRLGEEIAKMFSGVMKLIMFGPMKKYRPIKAATVAKAMIVLSNSSKNDIVYESDKLEELGK